MENNGQQGRKFGFTSIKTTEEKIEDTNKPEIKEVIESGSKRKAKEVEISKIVSSRLEAMDKFSLKPITISGKYDLEEDDDLDFTILARKLRKDKQVLASEYIKECLTRDLKKYGINLVKNN